MELCSPRGSLSRSALGPGKPDFFQLRRTETRVGTVTDPFRLSRIGKGTAPLPFVP